MSTDTYPPTPGPGAAPIDGDGAGAKAAEAAGQAQQSAQQAVGQAQEKLRQQLNQRSSQAAEQISEQASDLRSVSEALREQGKDSPAKAADRLAEYAERAGSYLRDKDSDALLADAEDFGRRRPWAAAAGGMALGFVASRFLKASSSQRNSTRSAGQHSPPRLPGAPESIPGEGLGATPSLPTSVPPLPGFTPPAVSPRG